MSNKNFTDFNYCLINSSRPGYDLVEVTYKYEGQQLIHFVYTKKQSGVNSIEQAKKIVQKDMESGKLPKHAYKSHKKLKIALASISVVAALTFAGLYTYKHLTTEPGSVVVITDIDRITEEMTNLNEHATFEDLNRIQTNYNSLSDDDKAKIPAEAVNNLAAQWDAYRLDETTIKDFPEKLKDVTEVNATSDQISKALNVRETAKGILSRRMGDSKFTEIFVAADEKLSNIQKVYNEQVEPLLTTLKNASESLLARKEICNKSDMDALQTQIDKCSELLVTRVDDSKIKAEISTASATLITVNNIYEKDKTDITNKVGELLSGHISDPETCSDSDITSAETSLRDLKKKIDDRRATEWESIISPLENAIESAREQYNTDLAPIETLLAQIGDGSVLSTYSSEALDDLETLIDAQAVIVSKHNESATNPGPMYNKLTLLNTALKIGKDGYDEDEGEIARTTEDIYELIDEDNCTYNSIDDARQEELPRIIAIAHRRSDDVIQGIAEALSTQINGAESYLDGLGQQILEKQDAFNELIGDGTSCGQQTLNDAYAIYEEALAIKGDRPESAWDYILNDMETKYEFAVTKRDTDDAIASIFTGLVNGLDETSPWGGYEGAELEETDILYVLNYYNNNVLPIYNARLETDPDIAGDIENDKYYLDEMINNYNQNLADMNQAIREGYLLVYNYRQVVTKGQFESFSENWNVIIGDGGIYQTRSDFPQMFEGDVNDISGELADMETDFENEETKAQGIINSIKDLEEAGTYTEDEINEIETTYDEELNYRTKTLADDKCLEEYDLTVLAKLAEMRGSL